MAGGQRHWAGKVTVGCWCSGELQRRKALSGSERVTVICGSFLRERSYRTMGVTVEREGSHGGPPVVDEVRSSGKRCGERCCLVCDEAIVAIFRQFSGGLLSSVI